MTANLPTWRSGACNSREESQRVPIGEVATEGGWFRSCDVAPAYRDAAAHFGLVRPACSVAAGPERWLRVLLRYADHEIVTRKRYWAWVHRDRNGDGTCHVDFDDGDSCRCTPAAAAGAARRMWRALDGRRFAVGDAASGRRHLVIIGFEADTGTVLLRDEAAAFVCCPVSRIWARLRSRA